MSKHQPKTWVCPTCGQRFTYGSEAIRLITPAAHLATNCPGVGTREIESRPISDDR